MWKLGVGEVRRFVWGHAASYVQPGFQSPDIWIHQLIAPSMKIANA